jgi:hypothetical protein
MANPIEELEEMKFRLKMRERQYAEVLGENAELRARLEAVRTLCQQGPFLIPEEVLAALNDKEIY